MERIRDEDNSEVPKSYPPCRVCNGPGQGFHYGVNTCDACKGFFHRSLRLNLEYRCENEGSCSVQYGKGLICRLCRYKKCLAVGMAKDASRTGRYSSKKKNEIIHEMNRLKQTKRSTFLVSRVKDIESIKAEPDFKNPHDAIDTGSRLPQPHDLKAKQAKLTTSTELSLVPASTSIQERDICYDTATALPLAEPSDWKFPETEVNSNYPKLSFTTSKSELSDYMHSRKDLSALDSRYSRYSLSLLPSLPNESSEPHNGHMSRLSKEYIKGLYADKDAVLQTLLKANLSAFSYLYDNWSLDTLQEDTHKHYELCQLRGQCGQVNQLSCTGSDGHNLETAFKVDENEELISKSYDGYELFLRKLIQFIRKVPGFRSLDVDDKARLIKSGFLEFNLIMSYQYCNTVLEVFRFTKNSYVCRRDMAVFELTSKRMDIFDDHIEGCKRLQTLDLRFEERVILLAMSILAPDRSGLTGAKYEIVNEIYWNLAQILVNLLSKRFNKPYRAFAKLVDIFTWFRVTEMKSRMWLKETFQHPYRLSTSPLTRELLVNSN